MTLAQKIFEMHVDSTSSSGPGAGYEGYLPAQPTLCIPALPEQDDSLGVGAGATGVTQLPAAVSLSSAWSRSLAYQYGALNGKEHRVKGIAMALAPGTNIQRNPRWGRNFEMLSEDPFLSSQLIVPDVEGLQSQHVMADVKHYDAYNQETFRNTPADNVIVSHRALHEIYMPAFHAATIKAKAASVMCSYATVNGEFSCQNPYLLTTTLNNRWGFQGLVRSDGGANHSTVASVNAGLDQEKGSSFFNHGLLAAAVQAGQVSVATINAAVSRIFTQMFTFGLFNHPPTGNLSTFATSPAHSLFARKVAEKGTVLLKDSHAILPLNPQTVGSVAVIGPDGTTSPLTAGGGSSFVTPPYKVSPLAGIEHLLNPPNGLAAHPVNVTSYSGTDPTDAAAVAKKAKVAIVFASNFESEGADLPNITLQNHQDSLISVVAAANPNTVVVLNTGGPVLMPWINQVKGVLEAWYPGQEDGNAIAAVLFGNVNPGGHLPETFPASYSQVPSSSPSQFPGTNGKVLYSEGIFVGYRWYNAHHLTPLFPFGYGLSYTTFKFSNLRVSPSSTTSPGTVRVAATVTNTGSRSGSEVAQLYVGDPTSTGEPPRQLKGFQKVTLAPSRSTKVHFTLTGRDMSWYDSAAHTWVVTPGAYQVYVGDSSAMADLPLHGSFQVTASTGIRHVTISAHGHLQTGKPSTVTATLTSGGNLTVHEAKLTLAAPAGWQVTPTTHVAAGTLTPGQALSASWRVTAPASAQDNIDRLAATATYRTHDATGTSTAGAQVTVDPLVTTTVSPQTVITHPGKATKVTLTNTDTSDYPLELHWQTAPPPSGSGVTATPASGSASLAPGVTATTTVTISVSSTAAPITFTMLINVTATADGLTLPGSGAQLPISIPYPSVAATYDNTGITNNSDPTPGNFDGYGNSYSAQALAAVGITGGSHITADGVTFTWPDVPVGQPDNVVASGQTIAISGTGGTLGLLGAVTNSSGIGIQGTGTITYTDGTTQPFTIGLTNWIDTTSFGGDSLVATTSYFNRTTAGPARSPSLFAASVPLRSGKSVAAVTLPDTSLPTVSKTTTSMHIFAVGVG